MYDIVQQSSAFAEDPGGHIRLVIGDYVIMTLPRLLDTKESVVVVR
jgi:hypothetical protein